MNWYFFVLLAMILYSIQEMLFKVTAHKKCDNNLTTLYFLMTVTIITVPFIVILGFDKVTSIGIVAAVVNGVFYSITTITRIGALKHIGASIVYPVMRLQNAVAAIFLILFLGERITLQNSIGIVLSVIAIYLLTQGEEIEKRI